MPRPPNDSEESRPARKSKRVRRTSTPRRSNSTTPRAELLAEYPPEYREAIEILFNLTPIQMLGLVIKLVLRDRVTNEELHFICNAYYDVIMHLDIYQD